jgi:hypothetical protein
MAPAPDLQTVYSDLTSCPRYVGQRLPADQLWRKTQTAYLALRAKFKERFLTYGE